jgi:DNA-binding NarL/FixJ family response regulator
MRIAVFSLDPIMGEALASLLVHTGGFEVVACSASLDTAQSILSCAHPDLLIFSEHFDTEGHRQAILELRGQNEVTTMLLCNNNPTDVPKDPVFDIRQSTWPGVGALCQAIRTSNRSERSVGPVSTRVFSNSQVSLSDVHFHGELTAREREAAELLAQGHNNKQIASILGVSEPTAKLYVSKLLRLLNCENRVQLALKLRELKGNTRDIESFT